MNTYYIIDFDSTFVKIEALDTLSEIVLKDHPLKEDIVQQIKTITNLGMEGKITFTESLQRRLTLFSPHRSHIQKLIEILNANITASVNLTKLWFEQNAEFIYIISGGFKEYILPVVSNFGINSEHILANTFVFNRNDYAINFDTTNHLSQPQGKVKAVASLQLQGNIIVIGDGYTDYEIRKANQATAFYVFTENITRESVVSIADQNLQSFTALSPSQ